MRKVFTFIIGTFIRIIILGIIGFVVANRYGSRYDEESKAYVDKVTPIIVSYRKTKELVDRTSSELLNTAPVKDLESLVDISLKQLKN